MKIIAGLRPYKSVNEEIKGLLMNNDTIELDDVNGQRYLGVCMDKGKSLIINGTQGNDLACYMNGGDIEVYGNGQDAVGNTMNGGRVIIHGHAGDALGYAMRDGEIYVQNDVSYRGGIHMKEFGEKKPVIVIGGKAGAFLGEYMAGGIIILLGNGTDKDEPAYGNYCATGMHGGIIYIKGKIAPELLTKHVKISKCTDEDIQKIEKYIKNYCKYFDYDINKALDGEFYKLQPASNRPFANMYTPN